MKRVLALVLILIMALSLSACDGINNELKYYSDPNTQNSNNTNQDSDESSQVTESQETSPYATGVVKIYAKNDSYDYYDMIFSNNRLIYVDLEDSNGMFERNCKGTFGDGEPNHILFSGMTHLTATSAIEFFEDKGFTVTVTQE